ncbi:MAG: UbiD family decarboxylase [Desulfuromonas sp.]|nr:UbiD family decarboxylase [Desulfuromonas sp.]
MDFRQSLQWVEQNNELVKVSVPVSGDLEIATIINRLCKEYTDPPVVLFSNVDHGRYAVVANLFAGRRRMQQMIQGQDGLSLAQRSAALPDTVSGWESFASWLAQKSHYAPHHVPNDHSRLLPDNQGFFELPQLKMWPDDAGCYLSLATMISRSVSSEEINCGIYRLQIIDNRHAAVHWRPGSDAASQFEHYRAHNQKMPVVIVVGCDPLITFASCTPLPATVDELTFAGWVNNAPVNVYQSEIHGLPVPVDCEFVLEGEIDPQSLSTDGPFANHSGYYSEPVSCPTFTLQRLSLRNAFNGGGNDGRGAHGVVWPITVVGPPPMENIQLAKAAEPLLRTLLCREFEQVVDVVFIDQAIFHGALIVQLNVVLGAELRKQLLAHPLLCRSRCVVFVDAEIDIRQPAAVFWRCLNQPIKQAVECRDGRLIVDTTSNGGRRLVKGDAQMEQLVSSRWAEYGL